MPTQHLACFTDSLNCAILTAWEPFPLAPAQVYRMHALLPDKVVVKDAVKGTDLKTVDFGDIIFKKGTAVNTTERLADLFTSLGMGHAGMCVCARSHSAQPRGPGKTKRKECMLGPAPAKKVCACRLHAAKLPAVLSSVPQVVCTLVGAAYCSRFDLRTRGHTDSHWWTLAAHCNTSDTSNSNNLIPTC